MSSKYETVKEAAVLSGAENSGWTDVSKGSAFEIAKHVDGGFLYVTEAPTIITLFDADKENTSSLELVRFDERNGVLVPRDITWTNGFIDRSDSSEFGEGQMRTNPMYRINMTARPKTDEELAELSITIEAGGFPKYGQSRRSIKEYLVEEKPWDLMFAQPEGDHLMLPANGSVTDGGIVTLYPGPALRTYATDERFEMGRNLQTRVLSVPYQGMLYVHSELMSDFAAFQPPSA